MFRLAWRVVAAGGALLPELVTFSEDCADPSAVRAMAAAVAAAAFGGEIRLTALDRRPIFTTVGEIADWDPAVADLPRSVSTTVWGRRVSRELDAASVRCALREVLARATSSGLLGDDDAVGLRRTADLLMSDRIAG